MFFKCSGVKKEKSFLQMVREIPLGSPLVIHPYDLESILLELEPLEKVKNRKVQAVVAGVKYKWKNFYTEEAL